MKQSKLRHLAKQLGQGMTEYIIIVAVVAVGSIAVYTAFGDVVRGQVAVAAQELAGGTGVDRKTVTEAQKGAADENNQKRNLTNF